MYPMTNIIYDLVVIGGGPAGMMTAGRAAELGAKVILLEKNERLGEKLLITGGGRCNVTNEEYDVRKFLSKYKESDKFLFSAFSQFSVKDTMDFFHNRGMQTKTEAGNRVFPASNDARTVWTVLIEYMKKSGVMIMTGAEVKDIDNSNNKSVVVHLKNGGKITAKNFVVATGGVSRPETGSTGDGFTWLKKLGHKIIEPDNALVPISLDMSGRNSWVKKLQGVSIDNVKITSYQNNQKQETKSKLANAHTIKTRTKESIHPCTVPKNLTWYMRTRS